VLLVFAHTDDVRVDPELRVHTFCHSVPDKWYLMGVTLFAGGAFQWLRNTLGEVEVSAAQMLDTDPYELMTAQAARAPAGSEGLVFLPYLMGERTPHKDANARGAFIGLTGRHGRPHMIRSVMEGVTFALRDSIEIMRELGLSVTQVRSTGGGARSSLWRQIQADIYGAEVVTVNAEEGPAFGAAILAAVGTGVYGTVEEAADDLVAVASRTEPDRDASARYEECYGIFRSMYPALKPGFDALGGMVEKQV
jgi:xylulokinase